MPGICASSSNRWNGLDTRRAPSIAAKAAGAPSTSVGSSRQLDSISPMMRRLVALSSTTSTRRPRSREGSTPPFSPGSALASSSRTVKWNVLPAPGWLSTHTRPFISLVSCEVIASPSPVPPYCRVVELSPCANASKMRVRSSGGMPMPVSLTVPCSSTSLAL
jgi:hypothetical protein